MRFIDHPVLNRPSHVASPCFDLGRDADVAAKALELVPEFAGESQIENEPFKEPSAIERFADGARMAELPVCATKARLRQHRAAHSGRATAGEWVSAAAIMGAIVAATQVSALAAETGLAHSRGPGQDQPVR